MTGTSSSGQRRARFAWLSYDWASSAWAMTIAVGVLPVFFARTVVPAGGVTAFGVRWDATALWGYTNSATTLAVFLFAPVLGAIADRGGRKRAFLTGFALMGAFFTMLLGTCGPGDVGRTLLLFGLSQVGFVSANVFYDAFLPHLGEERELDRLSGLGYAVGYVGGGVQFALAVALLAAPERLGIGAETAARLALASTGVWWAGFGAIAFLGLPERPVRGPGLLASVREGLAATFATTRRALRVKPVVLFLVAFLLYNDGVQTVVKMATLYGSEEIGVATPVLLASLFVIQLLAMAGSVTFGWLAGKSSTKTALALAVGLWLAVVGWGYVLRTPAGFVVLAGLAGFVLGAVQALSRSLWAVMIPREGSAELFGFFSVFGKLSGVLGTSLFAIVRQLTGTSRLAIFSLVVLFAAGLALLTAVDVAEGKRRRDELLPG